MAIHESDDEQVTSPPPDPLVQRYLDHVRFEKRLAERTVALYTLDIEKLAAHAVQALNALRQREHAVTVAVDLPSGLGSDPGPVAADVTITLGWPKDLLFTDDAAGLVGRLVLVPLTGLPGPKAVSPLGCRCSGPG